MTSKLLSDNSDADVPDPKRMAKKKNLNSPIKTKSSRATYFFVGQNLLPRMLFPTFQCHKGVLNKSLADDISRVDFDVFQYQKRLFNKVWSTIHPGLMLTPIIMRNIELTIRSYSQSTPAYRVLNHAKVWLYCKSNGQSKVALT